MGSFTWEKCAQCGARIKYFDGGVNICSSCAAKLPQCTVCGCVIGNTFYEKSSVAVAGDTLCGSCYQSLLKADLYVKNNERGRPVPDKSLWQTKTGKVWMPITQEQLNLWYFTTRTYLEQELLITVKEIERRRDERQKV